MQGRRFQGKNGKELAVIVIQSYWRGFLARRTYIYLKKRKWAVHVITSAWLRYWKLFKIRRHLKSVRHRQLKFFQLKQNEFKQQWLHISSNHRTIIHIPSLGLTESMRKNLKNLSLKENYQIGRLCELENPYVDVIYVSPMTVNDDILQYYNRLVRFVL